MHKLSKHVGDEETAVEWPNLFYRQETTGLDRLVIAPRRNPIGLLTELAKYIEPEYYLLYVLVASRGSSLQGRYQSPPLQSVDVRLFLDDFAGLLEHDARHHFWIGSTTTGDLLVYDDHGIIYAY
ncbi:MAG: hypothetical protein HY292_02755 [Planctomycetes bacterium]|nr:hypothetical protein [Planctomycetota bacterium]